MKRMARLAAKGQFLGRRWASRRPAIPNSAADVRRTFLDYFLRENAHFLVKSSPVVPFCDPTVAFVNAGMNQFKGVFLGHQEPKHKRVANSQKCIRVGGKHNDLSIVGTDGYHHTFFEMLGNWSFGDYFKKEACELAWHLLTGPYGLSASSLYVTYFGGDPKLGLDPDLECADIWRTLGVSKERLLPFGPAENFWEMGPTGPCGPCTEIHVDHTNSSANRANGVNTGLPDLTELWNIVFIQYNRDANGEIHLLPKRHVDTGMGLERLVALLQGKSSNYDTDLFTDLFKTIHKNCKNLPEYRGTFGPDDAHLLDTNYRIFADHSRMVTVCLSDGMIPEENQKLRRIIRKLFTIEEKVFHNKKGLLNEVCRSVVDNLGDVFPELSNNFDKVQQIISFEHEVYKQLRANSTDDWLRILRQEPHLASLDIFEMPSLVSAYRELKSSGATCVDGRTAFKLYDTHGLDEEAIGKLSAAMGLSFRGADLERELLLAKARSRAGGAGAKALLGEKLSRESIPPTRDEFKYSAAQLEATVLAVLVDGELAPRACTGQACDLVLDRTNFYSEAGGQAADLGSVQHCGASSEVTRLERVGGYVLHSCQPSATVEAGAAVRLLVEPGRRAACMRNHTAVHLLGAALKRVLPATPTCQRSSRVAPDWFNLEVGVYGRKLTNGDAVRAEALARAVVHAGVDVQTRQVDSQRLLEASQDVAMVPGEVYPDTGIRLVEIVHPDLVSREACCGTHVANTADLEDVCIVNFKSLGRSTTSLYGVTGARAALARQNGEKMLAEVEDLRNKIQDNLDSSKPLEANISELRGRLNYHHDGADIMPISVKLKSQEMLSYLGQQIRDASKDMLKMFIEMEMASQVVNCKRTNTNKPYLVHYLSCSSLLDNVPLQRATKVCQHIPVIVVSHSDGTVKARCCVPTEFTSEHFNADAWLRNTVAKVFNADIAVSKHQDSMLVSNMKPCKVNKNTWDNMLALALKEAQDYAKKYL